MGINRRERRGHFTSISVDLADSGIIYDEVNDRVGLGTASPGTTLQLEGTTPYITMKNSTPENVEV